MDTHRIDSIARTLARTSTRRGFLAAIIGLPLLAMPRRARAFTAPPDCDLPLVECDGECVNLFWDERHCGACGHECAAFQYCDAGTCVMGAVFCIMPETPCAGVCVNLQTDSDNCGICGNVCASGTSCVNGVCWGEAITCVPPLVDCDGDCVDLSSSFGNCGACGNACPGVQDAACCFGNCARLFSDPYNCGGCGNVCTANAACVQSSGADAPPNGICVCIDGYAACGEGCFDLSNDPYNCGACWNACAAGQACINGTCASTTTATATSEPTKTPEPTPTPTSEAWAWWTGDAPQHGAVVYQRRPLPGDDPIAMGDGPAGPVYIESDFARLAALGATYVVLSIPLPVTASDWKEADEDLLEWVDDLIGHASDAGLRVVIAPRTGPGRDESALSRLLTCRAGGCLSDESDARSTEETLWSDASARAAWEFGWTTFARRYRRNADVVGYELVSLVSPPSRNEWKRLAELLIAAIRAEDETTPILLNAPGEPARGLSNRLTRDPFTVHSVDWFAPERLITQEPGELGALTYPGRFGSELDGVSGAFDRSWLEEQFAAVAEYMTRYEKPVAVSAFGVPRWQPGAADYLADQIAVFDGLGINSALWLWYPSVWPAEVDAFDVTRGTDPDNHDTVANELLDAVRAAW